MPAFTTGNGTIATAAVVAKAVYSGEAATIPTVDGDVSPTTTQITLTSLGATYEYAITNKDGSVIDLPAWQASNVFEGLTANTAYKFKSRVAETTTHLASEASTESVAISTINE